jgi:uncharacterized protein YndB with AHSA1/START domain
MTAVATKGSATVTLQGEGEILVTREFDAPAHLVFRAFTTPELIKRWWHANRGEVMSAEVDLRVGGKWRWMMVTTEGGFEVAFHGQYLEIAPDQKLVYTEIFEAPDGDSPPSTNTMVLTEKDGRTFMTTVTDFGSAEIREAVLATGMEAGMQDAYDLLEELAISLS